MSWRDLLTVPERAVLPWLGGAWVSRADSPMRWRLLRRLRHHDWYEFELVANAATPSSLDPAPRPLDLTGPSMTGYLVGDRLVPDTQAVRCPSELLQLPRLHLLDDGPLDRFARVSAVVWASTPLVLVYQGQVFPSGPEPEVQMAYEDRLSSLDHVQGVSPGLEAAFRFEVGQRAAAEQRRAAALRRAQEEAAEQARLARRQAIAARLGDGAGRREMARVDFAAAAQAALAVGGAVYLDHRPSAGVPLEMTVRFRFQDRRFECTCHAHTLQVIDAGICLTAEYDSDDWEVGTRGDTWLSLESLPAVLAEAIRTHRLVVRRHV